MDSCMLCLVQGTTMDINTNLTLKTFCYVKILETCNDSYSTDNHMHMVCHSCVEKLQETMQFFKQCRDSFRALQMQYENKTKDDNEDADCVKEITGEGSPQNGDLDENPGHEDTASEINPKSKLCSFCGKHFVSHSKLLQHMSYHTGKPFYKCRYCEKSLTTKGSLIQHMQTHTGEKPFKCEFCPKAFVQSTQLNIHRKLHTGKDILCSICPKAFCRPSELKLHMRVHTGEVPYSCNECGKRFRLLSHLRGHEATHRNTRTFICKHCGAGFKQRSTLITHELIHGGEFKYKCALCDYSTYKKWSLGQHITRHHST